MRIFAKEFLSIEILQGSNPILLAKGWVQQKGQNGKANRQSR